MGEWKRKLALLLSTLAVLVIAVAPTISAKSENANKGEKNANYKKGHQKAKKKVHNTATITNRTTQESEEVDQGIAVENSGDNSNVCAAILQVANTGNVSSTNNIIIKVKGDNNTVDVNQYGSAEQSFSPELEVECNQEVVQTSSGGSGTPPPPPPPKEETKIEAKR